MLLQVIIIPKSTWLEWNVPIFVEPEPSYHEVAIVLIRYEKELTYKIKVMVNKDIWNLYSFKWLSFPDNVITPYHP